jgi:hypothetical protein
LNRWGKEHGKNFFESRQGPKKATQRFQFIAGLMTGVKIFESRQGRLKLAQRFIAGFMTGLKIF